MYFYKKDPRAITPTRNDDTDSGWDFFALEDTVVRPGEVVKILTGICVACNMGFPGFIWDKSSRGASGLKVLGGVIDNFYVGEIQIILANVNLWPIIEMLGGRFERQRQDHIDYTLEEFQEAIRKSTIRVPREKPIAQMVFQHLHDIQKMEELSEEHFRTGFAKRFDSKRADKGFGSSDFGPPPQAILDEYLRVGGYQTPDLINPEVITEVVGDQAEYLQEQKEFAHHGTIPRSGVTSGLIGPSGPALPKELDELKQKLIAEMEKAAAKAKPNPEESNPDPDKNLVLEKYGLAPSGRQLKAETDRIRELHRQQQDKILAAEKLRLTSENDRANQVPEVES